MAGFTYVSSSFATANGSAAASTIAVNTAVAAQADDVILAIVTLGYAAQSVSSIASTNTTWSRVTTFDLSESDQSYELWIGVLTGALSSESAVTASLSDSVPYRMIEIAHFRSDNGIASPAYNTYNSVTYGAGDNPTSANGFSVSVTPTGTNSLTAVEILVVEDEPPSLDDCSPQSGYTQITEAEIFSGVGPVLWAYKTDIATGAQNVTATYANTATNSSALVVVVLEGGSSVEDITLVVADCGNAHSADPVSLTQANILEIAEATFSHAADGIGYFVAPELRLVGTLTDQSGAITAADVQVAVFAGTNITDAAPVLQSATVSITDGQIAIHHALFGYAQLDEDYLVVFYKPGATRYGGGPHPATVVDANA